MSWVCDPWVGTGAIAWVVKERGFRIATDNLDPHWDADVHEGAMRPAFYMRSPMGGKLEATVFCPELPLLGVVLPYLHVITAQA